MLDGLRYGLRRFARKPGLTLTVVAVLSLGLGGSLMSLTLARSILLDPLPFPEADRLVTINDQNLEAGVPPGRVSYPSFQRWQKETAAFAAVAAFSASQPVTWTGQSGSERLETNFVLGDYFSLLGAKPALGRVFTSEEHATFSTHPVVILSHKMWQDRFGGSEDVLGATLRLNDQAFSVISVMPQGF